MSCVVGSQTRLALYGCGCANSEAQTFRSHSMSRFPLSRAFDAAAGPPSKQCPGCGRLGGEAIGVIILHGEEELSQCPECELPLGPHGNPVGRLRNGWLQLKVICLGDEVT